MRIKSAITLTVAFSFLLSGVYFAWLSPLNEYPNTQEIARSSSLLKPQETSQLSFDIESEKKLIYNIDASFQVYDQPSPLIPPTFSVKFYDPTGEIIRIHENVADVHPPQTITTKDSGTYKIEITNISNSTYPALINAYVQEVKNPTRPFEPVGHLFIFMALPIIGLGIWFLQLSKWKQNQMIEKSSFYFHLSRLLKDDKRIVFLFALYGLLAGIITYMASLSYDKHYLDIIAGFVNYPTVMILFVNPFYVVSISLSVFPIAIILASIAVWSFIGFIVYLFAKLFKLKDSFP